MPEIFIFGIAVLLTMNVVGMAFIIYISVKGESKKIK